MNRLAQFELGALGAVGQRGQHQPVPDVVQPELHRSAIEFGVHPVRCGVEQERQISRPEMVERAVVRVCRDLRLLVTHRTAAYGADRDQTSSD